MRTKNLMTGLLLAAFAATARPAAADDCAANDTQCSQATGAAVPADAVVAEDAGAPATPSDAVALPADAGAPGAEDTADDEALPADADASPGAREE